MKVESPLEFDLTGVISTVASRLAEAEITLFALATQDSDYLLVKELEAEQTICVLSQAGHYVDR